MTISHTPSFDHDTDNKHLYLPNHPKTWSDFPLCSSGPFLKWGDCAMFAKSPASFVPSNISQVAKLNVAHAYTFEFNAPMFIACIVRLQNPMCRFVANTAKQWGSPHEPYGFLSKAKMPYFSGDSHATHTHRWNN